MRIKDIALKAGVSTATVSNVINGNHHKVSQATIEKVQGIIEEMGYNPNATARSLASKVSRIIGVVIPNVGEEENFFINPHNAQLLALLEHFIRTQGYYMMVRCVGQCREILPLFSSWNVDGMIFFGTFQSEVEEIRGSLKVPTVFVDTYAEDLGIANVAINDYKGGYLSAQYLLSKGHRRIAFVGPSVDRPGVIQQRYRGFCDACAEVGVEVTKDCLFRADTLYDYGVRAGRKIAASPVEFTAVSVMSDIVAFGVMEGLRDCGKRVPEDISVIGFDDLPDCHYTNPKLTSVSQRAEDKARCVGETLFKMIRGESVRVDRKIDVRIVERDSVKRINTME